MNRRERVERRWWIWTLVAVALAGLVGLGVVLAATVLPPVLANLSTHVSEEGVPLVLHDPTTSATVQVPAGWLVSQTDDAHASIATPDRGMTVQVSLVAAGPDAALADAKPTGVLVEPLSTGTTVAHGVPNADTDAQIIAAVSTTGGSVLFLVSSDDPDLYRPALAALLEGVAP